MADKKKKNEKVTEEKIEESIEETVDKATEEAVEEEAAPPEKTEAEQLQEQVEGLSDKLMRTAAEFDNYKKRTAREKEDFYKMAVCETVLPLLSVLDNLDRAVTAAENTEDKGMLDGIKMIKKQFDEALTSIGVTEIEAVGCEFDPEKHNAVMMEESDQKENTIIEEFQKGYIYKDKVVRHSMVKVSN